MIVDEQKLCSKCETWLPLDAFNRANRATGLSAECKQCRRAMPSQSIERRRQAANAYYRKNGNASLYGLTPADYAKLLVAQNGVCAICGEPETQTYRGQPKRLSVDHCHDTDEIRGLLCSVCNVAIGMLRHDPALVEKARLYLLR